MRTFISIEFNDDVREYINSYNNRLRTACKTGNFSTPANFHLTLKFLGEIQRYDIEAIGQAMAETGFRTKKFSIYLDKLGFYQKNDSNILWLGLKGEEKLVKLNRAVENNMQREGFAKSRQSFSPHITLAREAKLYLDRKRIEQDFICEPKEIEVSKISLMESVRVGYELKYREILSASLK